MGGWGGRGGVACVSGMGEEGRPLWAGVIREPFMGETITGCDSGAPAEVSAAAASQPQPQPAKLCSIEQCAQPCTATHTHAHTRTPPRHIWPSLICCIRKDGVELKARREERGKEMLFLKKKKKKQEATQREHRHSSQIHDSKHTHTYTRTHPHAIEKCDRVWRAEPDSGGFYLRFGWG